MRALEPIPLDDLRNRGGRGRVSPYEELFQQALALDGLALPVEFDTILAAYNLRSSCSSHAGRGTRLGLKATVRGKTVYLYHPR